MPKFTLTIRESDNPIVQASLINLEVFNLFEFLQESSKDPREIKFFSILCVVFAHLGLCLTADTPDKLNELTQFILKDAQQDILDKNKNIN
jgi:hypothetical protein